MIRTASGLLLSMVFTTVMACNKKSAEKYNGSDTSGTVITVPDPAVAPSIGFFMESWKEKAFSAPPYVEKEPPADAGYTVTADASTIVTKISPALFGNNSNIYMSQMVTEPPLMHHLKALSPGIVRFPGGNLSSVFFWNAAPGARRRGI